MLIAIKQWAFTLVITAVAGSLANYFTISENGGMKKYVKFACSVVALAVMIMPIKEMFKEMPGFLNLNNIYANSDSENIDYSENIEQLNELAAAKTNELLKERIYDIVYEKTGIKPDDVFIYIGQKDYKDYIEVGVEKIIIYMPENTDNSKTEEIKLYLKQLFNCGVNTGEKTNE